MAATSSSLRARVAAARSRITLGKTRMTTRGPTFSPGRDRHQRIGMRHDGQGLWLYVPQRSRTRGACSDRLLADARHHGAYERDRAASACQSDRAARRLSQRVLAAAWAASARAAEASIER